MGTRISYDLRATDHERLLGYGVRFNEVKKSNSVSVLRHSTARAAHRGPRSFAATIRSESHRLPGSGLDPWPPGKSVSSRAYRRTAPTAPGLPEEVSASKPIASRSPASSGCFRIPLPAHTRIGQPLEEEHD